MAGTTDDTGTTLPTDEHASEQDGMTYIGMHLVDIESLNQTVRMELRKSEKNGDKATTLALESLLPRLVGLQSDLRKSFGTHTRPLIRKLHIFSLPEELLMKICEDVRGYGFLDPYGYDAGDVQDVKSLRLTCRRFCGSSSHMLLPSLRVTLTRKSLDRLDNVSQHPTISKGVRSLHICASLHNPTPAKSLRGFVRQVFGTVQRDFCNDLSFMLGTLDDYSADEDSNLPRPVNLSNWYEIVAQFRKRVEVLSSCTGYLRTGHFFRTNDKNMAALSQVHREHSQLLTDQQDLLESHTFATRIAEAVRRMPTITALMITDQIGYDMLPKWSSVSSRVYESVREDILTPKSWDPSVTSLLPDHPVKLLYQLPLAISKAGIRLTKLSINLNISTKHLVRLTSQVAKDLASAAQHLEELDLNYSMTMRDIHTEHPEEASVSLSKLTSLFLNSSRLKSVRLDFWNTSRRQSDEGQSAEPLLALLPWANLRQISLSNISIHYEELKQHLEKLGPRTRIALDDVYLLSGLWVDLLDVIRAKADCDSSLDCMDGSQDEDLDASDYEVNAYIQGELAENPLRPLQNHDEAVGTDAD